MRLGSSFSVSRWRSRSSSGVVTSGLSIYDTMQYIKPKVSTLVIGQAASMGSLLLAAGEPGMRFSLPNSRVMVHQPSGGYQGQATDIMIHAEETLKLKKRLNEIYVKHCGRTLEEVERALERDNFMSPEDAKAWGLIDEIVEKRGSADAGSRGSNGGQVSRAGPPRRQGQAECLLTLRSSPDRARWRRQIPPGRGSRSR